jgi:tRNA(fMet)-specific endonuclease VapC
MYLLDTNICIYLLNRKSGYENILSRIDGLAYEQVAISAITLAELSYGIAKSVKKAANRMKLDYFVHQFDCLPFDAGIANAYGEIRTRLVLQGTPIGPLDMLIATHALQLKATIVTNNVREFERVEGLAIENWLN